MKELIDTYGIDVIQAYMGHIQNNAEVAVREMLYEMGQKSLERTGSAVLEAHDKMDDGTVIALKISINLDNGSALFDFRLAISLPLNNSLSQTLKLPTSYFSGTGYQVWGNCNAPRAITLSAILYCLRSMVGHDVPLNQVPNLS